MGVLGICLSSGPKFRAFILLMLINPTFVTLGPNTLLQVLYLSRAPRAAGRGAGGPGARSQVARGSLPVPLTPSVGNTCQAHLRFQVVARPLRRACLCHPAASTTPAAKSSVTAAARLSIPSEEDEAARNALPAN